MCQMCDDQAKYDNQPDPDDDPHAIDRLHDDGGPPPREPDAVATQLEPAAINIDSTSEPTL